MIGAFEKSALNGIAMRVIPASSYRFDCATFYIRVSLASQELYLQVSRSTSDSDESEFVVPTISDLPDLHCATRRDRRKCCDPSMLPLTGRDEVLFKAGWVHTISPTHALNTRQCPQRYRYPSVAIIGSHACRTSNYTHFLQPAKAGQAGSPRLFEIEKLT